MWLGLGLVPAGNMFPEEISFSYNSLDLSCCLHTPNWNILQQFGLGGSGSPCIQIQQRCFIGRSLYDPLLIPFSSHPYIRYIEQSGLWRTMAPSPRSRSTLTATVVTFRSSTWAGLWGGWNPRWRVGRPKSKHVRPMSTKKVRPVTKAPKNFESQSVSPEINSCWFVTYIYI